MTASSTWSRWPDIRWPFAGVLLACSLVTTLPAQQAVAQSAALADSLKGEAKAAYESARLLFEDGDNMGALTKFRRAHELSRDPRLLWNMAVCEKELRRYGRAAKLIEQYLKEGAGRLTAKQRQTATETERALRAFYSSATLTGAPAGATVSVDGEEVAKTPLSEPLLLDLGKRRLRVELSGFEPMETIVDVPGNTALEVPVALQPASQASAPADRAVGRPARLQVSAGANDTVSINGKAVGSKEWEGSLPPGDHHVRVTAPGKKPYDTHVKLGPGAVRSLQVTLEDESGGVSTWLWVAGGTVLTAGAAVGGYFLLKPDKEPGKHPSGSLSTVYLPITGGRK